jgi:hypothetical protein
LEAAVRTGRVIMNIAVLGIDLARHVSQVPVYSGRPANIGASEA